MSADIIQIGSPFDRWTVQAVHELEHRLRAAIDEAKRADVPQGLIVALLVGISHQETATMLEGT